MLPVFDQTHISSPCDTVQTQTQGSSAVKKHDQKIGIAVHAWDTGNQVDWIEAMMKEAKPRLMKRQILEALLIQHQHTLYYVIQSFPALASAWLHQLQSNGPLQYFSTNSSLTALA